MKTHQILLAFSIALVSTALTVQAQLGGDPTTPPSGAPTRTMKTLDQIEARIPLVDGAPGVTLEANGGFTISASGSYFLVGNLALVDGDGVSITANNVTLDLNGFTISKTDSSVGGAAITGTDLTSIHIKNGKISSPYSESNGEVTGSGFSYGVYFVTSSSVRATNLFVTGCNDSGILGASGSGARGFIELVEGCVVEYCGGNGIYAEVVTSSTAKNCEGSAIVGITVSNSSGHSFGGYGINAPQGTVKNSIGTSEATNNQSGIQARIVSFSSGEGIAGHGILSNGGSVSNSRGVSTSNDGIGTTQSPVSNSYGYTGSVSHAGISATQSVVSFSIGVNDLAAVGISAESVIGSTAPSSTINASETHLIAP